MFPPTSSRGLARRDRHFTIASAHERQKRTEDDFVEKWNEKILGRFSTSKEPV